MLLFRDNDGTVPLLEWLDELPAKVVVRCQSRLARPRAQGHELRRPEADLLRDGIHELRVGHQGIHYRMLYFFHGNVAAVVWHGRTKQRAVPPREIDLAIRRRAAFRANPEQRAVEY